MTDIYGTDGVIVRQVQTYGTLPMWCEQHPDHVWPHAIDGRPCGGPGCPPEHAGQTLSEALEFIRFKAAHGVSFDAREWLDARGIAWEPADGVTDEGGQF